MSAVARRYAKALFALAKEADALQPTADQLDRLAAVVEDADLRPVIASPLLSPSRRAEMAQLFARELGLSDLMARFVRLVADHQRLGELPSIRACYQRLLDTALGRVRVTIRSATPLSPQHQTDVVNTFAKLTGKQVIPHVIIDATLLGGIIVEREGTVYDGSVRTHLDRLASQLTAASF